MVDIAHTRREYADLEPHQGDWLRKALDRAGISAKDMAEYLDVDPATVSRWINGRRRATKQTLRLWALRTGAPLRYLETGVIPDSPEPDYAEKLRTGNLHRGGNVHHVDFTRAKNAA